MALRGLFSDHPSSVNETYLEHMQMSSSFGVWLFMAMICAFVHALLPFMFETTASGIIKRLYSRMVTNRIVKTAPKQAKQELMELSFSSASL